MRFFKVILAIFLVFILTLSTVFFTRSWVVTSLVNSYLAQHHSVLTCIDFSLDSNNNLMISRLCIDSPYAEVELIDTLIEWHFKPSYLTKENVVEAISAIHISSASVRAKKNIHVAKSAVTPRMKLSNLLTLIKQQLHDAALLSMPVELNVEFFVYQPVSYNADAENQSYQGQLLATEQQLFFSLVIPKKGDILTVNVTKEEQGFNATLSTEIALLTDLLQQHKTVLPTDFSELLATKNNEAWSVSGHFNSEVNWHGQRLTMSNQLTDFSFQAEQGITQYGAIELTASLDWQTSLNDEILQIDFAQGNNIHLAFDQPAVIKLLTEKKVELQLIEFLTDNAMASLNIEPSASITVDFAKQTINSESINFTSENLNEPVKLSFNDIALSYHDESVITVDLHQAGISLVGQIKLAQLSSFTQRPLKLDIRGDIEQQSDLWQLRLKPGSTSELSQLVLPAPITSINASAPSKKAQPSIKTLLSHWQGKVTIPKNQNQNQTQAKSAETAEMSFDLHIDNQLKQLNLPKVAQVQTLELKTKLSGRFTDVQLSAKIIADNLPIASAKVSGNILQPHIDVLAKDVLITDLLALKLALPIELNLIDGMLNYHFSGQIKNTNDFMVNPMKLALSIKDVTGEVDGTWLQELNWRQEFIMLNGQVKSVDDEVEAENNLSIAKIETATPITNLSTKTFINFEHNELKIKANNSHGKFLGGRFEIAQAQWPFSKGSGVNVKLTNIDLEKLLELDKKQGIVVTGHVSGELPIYYDGKHFLIKEGRLHNVGDGLIQVFNNPAVAELKTSSTELKLAFDALENLHYHHLSSDVSMADDGYMQLITVIKGRNPDLDNEVNLNLNLSYDLLGLLESLNITEHFENKLIKGLH